MFDTPAAHSRGGPALLTAFTSAPSIMRSSMAGMLPAGATVRCGTNSGSQQCFRALAWCSIPRLCCELSSMHTGMCSPVNCLWAPLAIGSGCICSEL